MNNEMTTDLIQSGFQALLINWMKTDREFRESMTKVLLHYFTTSTDPTNIEMFKNLLKKTQSLLTLKDKSLSFSTRQVTSQLMKFLNRKDILAFVRVMRAANKLPTHTEIPEDWSLVFKELEFNPDWSLNLGETSKSVLEQFKPTRIKLFAQLNEKQRYFIESLTTKEIDVLSNFSTPGINVLAKLARKNMFSRNLILSMTPREIQLFLRFGRKRISVLYDIYRKRKTSFLILDDAEVEEIEEKSPPGLTNIMNTINNLSSIELDWLKDLIRLRGNDLKNLDMEEVSAIEEIHTLTEREKLLFLGLNNDQLKILAKVKDRSLMSDDFQLENILKVISSISDNMKYSMIHMQPKEIDRMLSPGYDKRMLRISGLLTEYYSIPMKVERLDEAEENVLKRLTPEQRTLLVRVYSLRGDGIAVLSQFSLGQLQRALRNTELSSPTNLVELRIESFSELEKHELKSLTNNDLEILKELMNSEMRTVLIDLSEAGKIVLKAMAKLNEAELTMIEKYSENGMAVLAGNNNLNRREILELMGSSEKDKRMLLNLSLKQRAKLENDQSEEQHKVDNPKLFSTIIPLTSYEPLQFQFAQDFEASGLNPLDSIEENIYSKLVQQEAEEIGNVLSPHLGEYLTFGLWNAYFQKHGIDDYLKEVLVTVEEIPTLRLECTEVVAHVLLSLKFDTNLSDQVANVIGTVFKSPFATFFHYHLYTGAVLNGLEIELKSHLFKKIWENPLDLEFYRVQCDFRDKQHLLFLTWIITMGSVKFCYNFARSVLLERVVKFRDDVLNRILKTTTTGVEPQIVKNIWHEQLQDDNYLLTKCFIFFKSEVFRKVSNVVFEPHQYFDILNSPLDQKFLTILRINHVDFDSNFLQFYLFWDRDLIFMLEKIDKPLFKLLFMRNPESLLRLSARNGNIDVLNVFLDKCKDCVREVIENNEGEILTSVIEDIKSNSIQRASEIYVNLSRTIRWFVHVHPKLDTQLYRKISSEYILHAQAYVDSEVLSLIIDNLATDYTSRHQLIATAGNELNSDVLRFLTKDEFQQGCSQGKGKRELRLPCVDSLESPEVDDAVTKVNNYAGLSLTGFFVIKHLFNRDLNGLNYDVLNLSIMPKIGEKVTKMMSNLRINRPLALGVGRAVSNFFAFVGLVKSVMAKGDSLDPIDIKIANLNIVSNSVFVTADAFTLATDIGEAIAPALIIAVIVAGSLVEAKYQLDKIKKLIQLTTREERETFWSLVLPGKIPERINADIEAKAYYNDYLTNVLDSFKSNYDKVAVSLTGFYITKEEHAVGVGYGNKRSLGTMYQNSISIIFSCKSEIRAIKSETFISGQAKFEKSKTSKSRLLPDRVGDYELICGPSANDTELVKLNHTVVNTVSHSCHPRSSRKLSEIVDKLHIPNNEQDSCQNLAYFEKANASGPTMFYILQNVSIELSDDDSIDMVFHGKNISVTDLGTTLESQNVYRFVNEVVECKIHKKGFNIFYLETNNHLNCDLGENQINAVMVQDNFEDSSNIHAVIGSEKSNVVMISHAHYVDGKGGNDTITSTNSTVIKGYFGDSIHGNATILLPIVVNEIEMIVVYNKTIIYNDVGESMEVNGNVTIITHDGYTVDFTEVNDENYLVKSLHVKKSLGTVVILDDVLLNLREIKNENFNMVKHLTSNNYDVTLSDFNYNNFIADKDDHNYYWEGPKDYSHLYLMHGNNTSVIISQANGILDLQMIKNGRETVNKINGTTIIQYGNMQVSLLPNYGSVTVTFDGEKYFNLEDIQLKKDYCSHELEVKGYMNITGSDMTNYFNCFTFFSDRVHFFKHINDLVLFSNNGSVLIKDYKIADAFLKLNYKTLTPRGFRERADNPTTVRYYNLTESGSQIYHNQPNNAHSIGVVDFGNKSVLNFDMKLIDTSLYVFYRNEILAEVENWKNYHPGREMMFLFNDSIVNNEKCMFSYCLPKDVIQELKVEKSRVLENHGVKRERRETDERFFWLNGIVDTVKDVSSRVLGGGSVDNRLDYGICLMRNVGLAFSLVQNYFDRKFPIPEPIGLVPEEVLCHAAEITEQFERTLDNTAKGFGVMVGDVDFFQVYREIVDHMTNERYSRIFPSLCKSVKIISVNDEEFYNVLYDNVQEMLNNYQLFNVNIKNNGI